MKKYMLKKWYPSLGIHAVEGIIIERKEPNNLYVFGELCIPKHEVENNPDFWELIEEEKPKPLFITEDGVEVLSDINSLYAVNLTYFNKTKNTLRHSGWLIENSAYKVFYHESNADEYIWRNKPLFSYHEIWKYAPYGSTLSIFEKLAKERVEQ